MTHSSPKQPFFCLNHTACENFEFGESNQAQSTDQISQLGNDVIGDDEEEVELDLDTFKELKSDAAVCLSL